MNEHNNMHGNEHVEEKEIIANGTIASPVESSNRSQASTPYLIPGSIVLAGIIIAGAVMYSNGGFGGGSKQPPSPVETGLQATKDDVVLGDAKAPVTIIEYGDYQCPFCSKFFAEIEPAIIEKYVKTGKAKFIFRSFQFLGPESGAAAEAVYCAKEQGKFWEYHDAVYAAEHLDGQEQNGNLNRNLFLQIADGLNLDKTKFSDCIDGRKYAPRIQEDAANGQKVGVSSTPTTFVNGTKILGAVPFEQISAVIDQALKNQ